MTTTTPITARVFTRATAAAFLAAELGDGRDFSQLLADDKRGRRRFGIPSHKALNRRVSYLESDLLDFVANERAKGSTPLPSLFKTIVIDDRRYLLTVPERLALELREKH